MSSDEPLRVAMVSLGCPKALVDSEKMLALLAQAGQGPGRIAEPHRPGRQGAPAAPRQGQACLVGVPEETADVIVINTCAFIRPAREESMRAIRRAVARKRRGRVRRVVVAGCLPQREAEGLLSAEPGIDAIIGVFNREDITAAVTSDQTPFIRVGRIGRKTCPDDRGRLRLTPRHTAYLRLSEGCSSGCSFCTIPAIRGPIRSKPMGLVVEEAAELVSDGALEINLIAQDTTAYGADLDKRTNLARLLRRLDALDGLRWLRIMYANPATLTDEVIEAIAERPRIVKYIDLPLQHVSDKILRLMRRRYDRARLEGLLEALRARVPGIALRTTFIVGFPQERPRDFQELLAFVKEACFEAVGVFTYWREAGTVAAGLRGQVSDRTKRRRRERLMRVQQEIVLASNAARVCSNPRAEADSSGSKAPLEVLVDGVDPQGRCVGRHAGQAPEVDGLCLLTSPVPSGRIVECTVVGYDGYDLIVEVQQARAGGEGR